MSNKHPYLPLLTVNRAFMQEFFFATPPCFALGLMEEEGGEELGFLAMRPDKPIPSEITNKGFNFGHSLIGTDDCVVIQFVFEFYGFGRYYTLLNPNNPVVQTILSKMIESGNYFFFAINQDKTATTFRATISQGDLAGLKTNFPLIQEANTTEDQYHEVVSIFSKNPQPLATPMNWICRDNMDYLDLTKNRFELKPV